MSNYSIIELNEDYYKKYNKIIIELTGKDYSIRNEIKVNNRYIFILLVNKKVIACGSLFIHNKIHCNNIGIIEDIIVSQNYRTNGYGKLLIEFLVSKAKTFECYKVILGCQDKNIKFYEKSLFHKGGIEMCKFLL